MTDPDPFAAAADAGLPYPCFDATLSLASPADCDSDGDMHCQHGARLAPDADPRFPHRVGVTPMTPMTPTARQDRA